MTGDFKTDLGAKPKVKTIDDVSFSYNTAQARLSTLDELLCTECSELEKNFSQLDDSTREVHREMLLASFSEYRSAYIDMDTRAKALDLSDSDEFILAELKGKFAARCSQVKLLLSRLLGKPVVSQTSQPTFLKLPDIKISPFTDNSEDPLAFSKFKTSFENAMKCQNNITSDQKIIFLKTVLRGHSLALVADQNNFDSAWKLLEYNFLNLDVIIDSIFDFITNTEALHSIKAVSEFFKVFRVKIVELENLGLHCVEDSFGCKLICKLLRLKLPSYILQELSRRTGTNFPSVCQILKNIDDIVTMFRVKPGQVGTVPGSSRTNMVPVKSRGVEGTRSKITNPVVSTAGSKQISGAVPEVKCCKFCKQSGHCSSKCSQFKTVQERKRRAESLNICSVCLSPSHVAKHCKNDSFPFKCYLCNSSGHLSAFCTKSCNDAT